MAQRTDPVIAGQAGRPLIFDVGHWMAVRLLFSEIVYESSRSAGAGCGCPSSPLLPCRDQTGETSREETVRGGHDVPAYGNIHHGKEKKERKIKQNEE